MRKILVWVSVTVLPAVLLAPFVPAPASAAPSTSTYVTSFSDRYDYVGDGTNHLWLGDGHVSASALHRSGVPDGNTIEVDTTPSESNEASLHLAFVAPGDDVLTTGSYTGVARDGTQTGDQPGMVLFGDLLGYDDNRECPYDLTGSFTVRDMAPDLSRLWITYEQHCSGMPEAMYGEIRINEPDDGELLVAPGQVQWPAAYRDVHAHEVPVTLVNKGAMPVQVSGTTISAGAAEFSVAGTSCGTIAPGGSCTVDVGYVPRSGSPHQGQLTISDSTTAGSHVVPLASGIIPGYTSWRMHSQHGDYVGDGRDYAFLPADRPVWALLGRDSRHAIRMTTADGWWDATFAAPLGQTLQPGATYTLDTGSPDWGDPTFDVSGDGRGCGSYRGSFRVRELSLDQGHVQSFAVTFRQHCAGDTPELVGSIAWHADQPAAALPTLAKLTPGLSVVPTPSVRVGDTARVSGRLYSGEIFEGLADKRVAAYSRPHSGGAWRLRATTRTDSEGNYVFRFATSHNTDYQTRFAGDVDHVAARSRIKTTLARWWVHMRNTGKGAGERVRLRCEVDGGRRNQVIVLKRLRQTKWITVWVRHLNAEGVHVFRIVKPTRGALTLNCVARATSGRASGGSGMVQLNSR